MCKMQSQKKQSGRDTVRGVIAEAKVKTMEKILWEEIKQKKKIRNYFIDVKCNVEGRNLIF